MDPLCYIAYSTIAATFVFSAIPHSLARYGHRFFGGHPILIYKCLSVYRAICLPLEAISDCMTMSGPSPYYCCSMQFETVASFNALLLASQTGCDRSLKMSYTCYDNCCEHHITRSCYICRLIDRPCHNIV